MFVVHLELGRYCHHGMKDHCNEQSLLKVGPVSILSLIFPATQKNYLRSWSFGKRFSEDIRECIDGSPVSFEFVETMENRGRKEKIS